MRPAVAAQDAAGAADADGRFQRVFEDSPIGMALVDRAGVILEVNAAAAAVVGVEVDELRGRPVLEVVATGDRDAEQDIARQLWSGTIANAVREAHLLRPGRDPEPVLATTSLVGRPGQPGACLFIQVEPIGDRRRAETHLRETQSALDAIVTVDGAQRIISWNDGAERLFGHPRHAALGKDLELLVPPELRRGHEGGFERLAAGGPSRLLGTTVVLKALHADGRRIPIELSLSRWHRGDAPFFTAIIRDITERVAAEEARVYAESHDPITGLGNLALLRTAGQAAVREADESGRRALVLVVDAAVSPELLRRLGAHHTYTLMQQLAAALSASGGTAYHLGGFRFAIVAPVTAHAARREAGEQAERVLRAAQVPLPVAGLPIELTATVGAAVSTGDAADEIEGLLRQAESARQSAADGPGVYADAVGGDAAAAELELIRELREAVFNDQLRLHYQPLVSGGQTGPYVVEALVRWEHPQLGLLAPARFVPLSEHTSLIHDLTRWVLAEAIRQRRRWADAGRDVMVAVNLSARVLGSERLTALIGELLERYRCPADRLELEVTESVLIADPGGAARAINQLRALGVRVALDDFGTGYTSLQLLRDLDVDTVKIDRRFVAAATQSRADAAIVQAVVDLAHRIGAVAVAEGVEDPATSGLLVDFGCDLQQGFHFSRALPPEQLEAWWSSPPILRRRAAALADDRGAEASREQLEWLVAHDPMTGLPNRRELLRRLQTAHRRGGVLPMLAFVDLNHFKAVNDTHGHLAGDAVLLQVAQRLRMRTRDEDAVARFGGDEFVIVFDDDLDAVDVEQLSARLGDAFADPFAIDAGTVVLSASIGVVSAEAGWTPESLLAAADAAMYEARAADRGAPVPVSS